MEWEGVRVIGFVAYELSMHGMSRGVNYQMILIFFVVN